MKIENNIKKVVVVSGSNGYLGKEIVNHVISHGFFVAGIDLYIENELASANFKLFKSSLPNESEVDGLIKKIESECGEIYACISASGIKQERKGVLNINEHDLNSQFMGNTFSPFYLLKSCAALFKERKQGVLIGVTSIGIIIPESSKFISAYIASKFAIHGLLSVMNEELKKDGVRVHSVAPGFMHGGMNKDTPRAFADLMKTKNKSNKITEPSDVAIEIVSLLDSGEDRPFLITVAEECNN